MSVLIRRLAGTAAAVVALGAVGAPAALADHTQQLDVGARLVRQQAGGKPWIVNLSIGADLGSTDGTVPSPIRDMRFSFTKGAEVHPEAFATCTLTVLTTKGPAGCPSDSRLGKGTAVANVLGTAYPATIAVFNGPEQGGSRKVLFYARALQTVVIPIQATLKRASGAKYGWALDVPVQQIQVTKGQFASITSFAVTVGGIGRKGVPFIEAPTSCSGAGWPFLGKFTYQDGATGTASATISCLLKGTSGG